MKLDNNKKSILIYGYNKEEVQLIETKLYEYKLPQCKVISDNMFKMKMNDIINGMKFEILNKDILKEKAVIFNNFNDEELSLTIDLIKTMFEEQPIFAAITETTIEWTFEELLKHLIEERNWYRNHS